jgi:hypothetical protein
MVWCFSKYRDQFTSLLYLYLKEKGWKNLTCPRYSPLLDCCEHDEEPLGSTVAGYFFTILAIIRLSGMTALRVSGI